MFRTAQWPSAGSWPKRKGGGRPVGGRSEKKRLADLGHPYGRRNKMLYGRRQPADTVGERGPGGEPPMEEPPNAPRKPPVKEPGKPPESPPPPKNPPMEEPPNRPPEPPVEEPPPANPNRKPPRPPVRRAHPMASCIPATPTTMERWSPSAEA